MNAIEALVFMSVGRSEGTQLSRMLEVVCESVSRILDSFLERSGSAIGILSAK
jgi:hypothetical protein